MQVADRAYTPAEEARLWAWLADKVEELRKEQALDGEPGTELPEDGAVPPAKD